MNCAADPTSHHASVRARILKAIAAQGFGQTVTLLFQIIAVPLFLRFWGKTAYGEWLLLTTIPTCIALTDLGFANAAANEMTMCVAAGDRKAALRVFHSTWCLLSVISIVVTILTLTATAFLPVDSWLHLTTIPHHEFVAISLFLVLGVIFQQQRSVLYAGYQCDGLYARSLFLTNVMRLVEVLVGVIAILLGGRLLTYALVLFITRIVESIVMTLDLKAKRPWLTHDFRGAHLANVKRLLLPSLAFLSLPISNAINQQGILMAIGIVRGPQSVADYSIFRTLTRVVFQVSNAISSAVGVEMAIAFGRNDMESTRRFHADSSCTSLWVSLAGSAALAFCAKPVLRLWTSKLVGFNSALFYCMLAEVIVNCLWLSSSSVLTSINRHTKMAAVYVGLSFASLLMATVCLHFAGLVGAPIALLALDVGMTWYTVNSSVRILRSDAATFYKRLLMPPFSRFWFSGGKPVVATIG